ncbi:MAG: MFS transporter [Candidatus Cyclobacteriaceae bacterium M2_1C_046]
MAHTYSNRVYTKQFWLLCISSFLFFASFNMIIPELPAYMTSLGGEEYIGWHIALFTITAGLSRPFSGKLADRIGRIPVMIFGAVVCFFMGLIYPFTVSIFGFLLIRFFHGFSTGFKPTGTAAYAADIVPIHRRGEAMGAIGMAGNLGMASGPTLGSALAKYISIELMFYTSSVVAILSILILIGMTETLEEKQKFKWSMLKIGRHEIIDPAVLTPSIVMVLCTFSFGMVLTVIPDFSDYLDVKNRGYFFTIFTISSLVVRIIGGKVSDKYGRAAVLKLATFLIALSLVILAITEDKLVFFIAGVVFGLGNGLNSPTLFAWTVDLSDPKGRGRAMATIFIALELGITIGALASGWIYANNATNFPATFLTGAFLAFLAFLFLFFRKRLGMA